MEYKRPLAVVCALLCAAVVACNTFIPSLNFFSTPLPTQGSSTPWKATLVVNTVDDHDDGACTATDCTLREAITQANSASGTMIQFNIPGSGAHTIQPKTTLPALSSSVLLDGRSQPGYSNSPIIELDGSLSGFSNGITFGKGSDGSVIRGFVINKFSDSGIYVIANKVQIYGNFIGTDINGSQAKPNQYGIWVDSMGGDGYPGGVVIGGTTAGMRNVISGNQEGILLGSNEIPHGPPITYQGASTLVQGNYIGTDASGAQALGNTGTGVFISTNANIIGGSAAGAGNVISANKDGIIVAIQTNTIIQGNRIGTDATGQKALGNSEDGVQIAGGNNQLGGSEPGAGNLISANGRYGVSVTAQANPVQGNYIGTNADGTAALGNGADGIRVDHCYETTVIGGTNAAARNIISGNSGDGIRVMATEDCSMLTISGNYIGTDKSGAAALGNAVGVEVSSTAVKIGGPAGEGSRNLISGNTGDGVRITGIRVHVEGNFIGTNAGGEAALGNGANGVLVQAGSTNEIVQNVIAFNHGAGVEVLGTGDNGAGTRNRIEENTIYNNGGLGIALDQDAVIPNDSEDTDTGANTRQNFPVITSGKMENGKYVIQGTLNSTPGQVFKIFVYTNLSCDPSGYGEGAYVIGSMSATSNISGMMMFTATLPVHDPSLYGTILTATATDPNGNTSEFSKCFEVAQTPKSLVITPTFTPTFTPTAASLLQFIPRLSTNLFQYQRDCIPDPGQITISVTVSNPAQVSSVVLFFHLQGKTSGTKTEWNDGIAMTPKGGGMYQSTVSWKQIPSLKTFSVSGESTWFLYQFAATDKNGAVLVRSPVYNDVTLEPCS